MCRRLPLSPAHLILTLPRALDLKSWKRDEFLNNVVAKLIEGKGNTASLGSILTKPTEDHGDPKQKRLAEARRRKALGFLVSLAAYPLYCSNFL